MDLESFSEIGADAMHYEDRWNARTPEEEYERRFDQDMAAREGECRDWSAEREEEEA